MDLKPKNLNLIIEYLLFIVFLSWPIYFSTYIAFFNVPFFVSISGLFPSTHIGIVLTISLVLLLLLVIFCWKKIVEPKWILFTTLFSLIILYPYYFLLFDIHPLIMIILGPVFTVVYIFTLFIFNKSFSFEIGYISPLYRFVLPLIIFIIVLVLVSSVFWHSALMGQIPL